MLASMRTWSCWALLALSFSCSSSPKADLQSGNTIAGSGAAGISAAAGSAAAAGNVVAVAAGSGAPLPPGGACCEAQSGPGCSNTSVRDCVCAGLPECCSQGWDIVCASFVESTKCGSCQSNCCESRATQGGCTDPKIQQCVCALDNGCCNRAWDSFCVILAEQCDAVCP